MYGETFLGPPHGHSDSCCGKKDPLEIQHIKLENSKLVFFSLFMRDYDRCDIPHDA